MTLLLGDSLEQLKTLESESVQTCITSPPYWGLRDYGVSGQLGLEPTPSEYVQKLVLVFDEVKRVLTADGTLWLNLGDSYVGGGRGGNSQVITGRGKDASMVSRTKEIIGLKPKDLVGIPWRVAFALQENGWYLRQDIIWHKPNPMPESVTDRCTKAHEYIFLLSKSQSYFFDNEAIKEAAKRPGEKQTFGGAKAKNSTIPKGDPRFRNGSEQWGREIVTPTTRNKRSVWTVTTKPFKGAHFATFPPDLIEPCILAGSRKGDTVLDPFFGAGTTGVVAKKHERECIGIELNPEYMEIAKRRVEAVK